MRIAATTLAAAIYLSTAVASAGDGITRRIRLLSVSFDLPKKLLVETEGADGVEEIVAMSPGKCATQYCPPVVMAWECRFDADGTSQVGFTVFRLKSGSLVVSYLGGEKDLSPGSFFDGIAKSMKLK